MILNSSYVRTFILSWCWASVKSASFLVNYCVTVRFSVSLTRSASSYNKYHVVCNTAPYWHLNATLSLSRWWTSTSSLCWESFFITRSWRTPIKFWSNESVSTGQLKACVVYILFKGPHTIHKANRRVVEKLCSLGHRKSILNLAIYIGAAYILWVTKIQSLTQIFASKSCLR